MVLPVLCICASAASTYVQVSFVFVISVSAFPWVSCLFLVPPAGHGNAGSVLCFDLFCLSSVSLPPLVAFRLVSSCRPSVGTSPGHIIRLMVPTNSDLVLSGPCTLSACVMIGFIFSFPSFIIFFSFPLRSFIFWGANARKRYTA